MLEKERGSMLVAKFEYKILNIQLRKFNEKFLNFFKAHFLQEFKTLLI